jgi:hypothetical protein
MELSHDLILGTDWINQIVGNAIHPSTSSVIIEPFTDHSSCSEEDVTSFSFTCQSTKLLTTPNEVDWPSMGPTEA